MMLNRLTLTALCFTVLVRGQTQLDLNKQVRNALPIASGGTQAANQIDARKNVGTPFLVATDFPGGDIGAKVNACFASFSANTCGTCVIPPGLYTYATPILVKDGCTLQGGGSKGTPPSECGGFPCNMGTFLEYNGSPATSAIYTMNAVDTQAASNTVVRNLAIRSAATPCADSTGFGANLEWNNIALAWQCVNYGFATTIASTTNATPIVATAAGHGLATGDSVLISGVRCSAGNCAANGHFQITRIDANTFSLNGSTGNGPYQSGGTAEKLTWSAATPHLAAIQHGLSTLPGTRDGRWNKIENITIDGFAPTSLVGTFHFGIFLNGCEDCSIYDTSVNSADFGFSFGPATQPLTAANLSARVNKLAGYQDSSTKGSCIGCLAESNQWFPRSSPNHELARRYGAGVRIGGKFPGDTSGVGDAIRFINFYREANDIDFLGDPNCFGCAINTDGAGAGGIFADQGNFDGTMMGCGSLNTSNNLSMTSRLTTDCAFTAGTPPQRPGTVSYQVTKIGPGETKKITDTVSTLGPTYEQNFDPLGGNRDFFFRLGQAGSVNLYPNVAANAGQRQIRSAALAFGASVWNGSSADLPTARIAFTNAQVNGAADTAAGLFVAINGDPIGNRNFSFREKSVFRISHNNVGDTPTIEIGAGDHPSLPPEDNTSPTVQFVYKSANGSTSPHLRSYSLNGPHRLDINTGVLQLLDNSGANVPITFRTKPSSGQTANQQEWGDSGGNITSFVSSSGALALAPSGAQPACDSTHRFWLWTTAGGAGVKDKVEVCAKDAADIYAWRAIF